MNQHQGEKSAKILHEEKAENGESPDKVAEGEKFFRGKVAVGKLVRKKDADERSNGKGAADQGLLRAGKTNGRHVTENWRQPRSPNKKFQHHHYEEFETGRVIHKRLKPKHKELPADWQAG